MKRLQEFDYYLPATVSEAIRTLNVLGTGGKILAGGTDVLVAMKEKGLRPRALVDIKGLAGLRGISQTADGSVVIGALTTLHEIETSAELQGRFSGLAEAAGLVGSYQVRNRATLGGNLCNASPSADSAPALIAYGAFARIVGFEGERRLLLEDFFAGPGKTVLSADEILTAVELPSPPERSACAYVKYGPRAAMDIAVVGAGVLIGLDAKGVCQSARIVLAAVGPTPLRAKSAEDRLTGRYVDEAIVGSVAKLAAREARPIDDIRASAAYRSDMIEEFTARAIKAALAKLV